jgi:2-polyprenyl-6-methoxyphenol hydroxylase-like FAD-dependent oxidoreductase
MRLSAREGLLSGLDTDVMIVGGGPVGLSLALDLSWRGIGNVLIEKNRPDERRLYPRMDNVGIRTMELCRRWGIVSDVEASGFPRSLPTSIVYTTGILGHELARDNYPAIRDSRPPAFSPQKHELCPQNFFDPVLQRAVARYPQAQLKFEHRLIDFTQFDDHVLVKVEDVANKKVLEFRTRYLVGCDGAGSKVAEKLQIAAPSSEILCCSTNIFIRCPELAQMTQENRAYRYIMVGDDGVWGSFVNIDGRDVWRLQLLGDQTWPEWRDEEVEAFVRRGIGADIPFEVLSWVPWSRREYVVEKFHEGRCFLAGDAVHQLSPTGGYGMNTGVAEAVDLSWKLAAVLQGWGGDALLDSYTAERQPIAARNVAQATENLAAMRSVVPQESLFSNDPDADQRRADVGARIQSAMSREWRSFGIHLGATYYHSPIIVESETDTFDQGDVANYIQTARPGARAPHVVLEDGTSTLDLFGRGFVLLDFAGRDPSDVHPVQQAARAMGVPFKCVRITHDGAREVYGSQFVLVRPDGHVAWRGDTMVGSPERLLRRVCGFSEASKASISDAIEINAMIGSNA